jgi:iron(III)-salmochelin esterase
MASVTTSKRRPIASNRWMRGKRAPLVAAMLLLLAGCGARRCNVEGEHGEMPSSWVIPKASGSPILAPVSSSDTSPVSTLKQGTEELTWTFDQTAVGRIDVVVVLPDRKPGERFPLLIALHGRGEAMKGPVRGARGWVDDYALGHAIRRLSMPPLRSEDFEDIVDAKRLNLLNASLQARPYGGLVVLCPYTPDMLAGERPFERAQPFARFLVETLIPRAKRELPVIDRSEATGIDGVSLGGRVSLLAGLHRPESFGAIATLQAAFDSSDAPRLAAMALTAKQKNPKLQFRFLTSDGDYFLAANHAIDQAFSASHIAHEFIVVPGPHDYIFNRGPGAIEMLLFHDRALRRFSPR